jgi:hypothetical protein
MHKRAQHSESVDYCACDISLLKHAACSAVLARYLKMALTSHYAMQHTDDEEKRQNDRSENNQDKGSTGFMGSAALIFHKVMGSIAIP